MAQITKEEAVKKALDKLLQVTKSNVPDPTRSGTGGDNACFGTVEITGEVRFNAWACHAMMKGSSAPVVVYNQFRKRPEPHMRAEALKMFFDWIRSDDGPWRAFEGRNVSHVPEGWSKSVEDFMWEHGWVWSDIDKYPSNLQHSFLTVARMAPEWPPLINKWHDWVLQGCDKALAFVFLDVFKPKEQEFEYYGWGYTKHGLGEPDMNRWHLNRKNRYDWPLDVCTSGEEYVVNFLNGRVEALNKPYKENTNYRPVNRIFGANEKDCMDPTVYPSIIFQLYASTYGPGAETLKKEWKPSRLGLSEFSHEKSWYVSEAEVVDIIKEEGKRLYGKSADNANQNLPGIESVSSGMRDRLRDSKGRFRAA